ncbi:Hypothetical protein PENO1_088930 [Penicillium occitanis (nom. inval.)]|nr:Hypothetical protein PENO1_088930 [Penicillium occitanis (nom. inval.)]PCG92620.1 hypothetical protein PENOC_091590 [Penicillium occitanis (nom. inval.)]
MERYLLENTEPYKLLVQRFKPPHRKVAERIQKGINPTTSVVARIRPILDEEVSSGQVVAAFPRDGEDDTVDVHELLRVIRGLPAINSSTYRLGKVFSTDSTTQEVYYDIIQPLLPYAGEGNVGTLFAFGQTGSGKTFAISQLERLVAKALFGGTLQGEKRVHVSVFELAGNSAFGESCRKKLSVLHD